MTADDPLHIATLSTRHFYFMAAGESEKHACDTMRAAWAAHAAQFGATLWTGFATDR
uniref:hypothetical protein n=1 Tax=Amycolatopsis sp. CA-096443 TaxID=3239919 RepID=UPI003F493F6F